MQISLDKIKDLSVTVMGLGLNGGGSANAEFFARHGAQVTVADLKSEEELKPSIEKLTAFPNIRFVLGEHRIEDFEKADIVIKNPGVKREGNKFLQAAEQVESDISIFTALSKAPLLAVTGSKGKSSTVSAVHYGLNKAGIHSLLGGNITVSPLSFLDQTDEKALKSCGALPVVVLELSSWQLADLRGRSLLKPYIALISEIVPDHQNWYGSMENYGQNQIFIKSEHMSFGKYMDITNKINNMCYIDEVIYLCLLGRYDDSVNYLLGFVSFSVIFAIYYINNYINEKRFLR